MKECTDKTTSPLSFSPAILHSISEPTKIFIVDIPKSTELTQGPDFKHNLLSVPPITKPFPSLEPKSEKAKLNLRPPTVEEIITQRYLELTLSQITKSFNGPWCLTRHVKTEESAAHGPDTGKRGPKRRSIVEEPVERKKSCAGLNKEDEVMEDISSRKSIPPLVGFDKSQHVSSMEFRGSGQEEQSLPERDTNEGAKIDQEGRSHLVISRHYDTTNAPLISPSDDGILRLKNTLDSRFTTVKLESSPSPTFLPPRATALQGDISSTLHHFTNNAPQFNFILMDPPWPNRSARRKGGYGISYNTSEIRKLLTSLPLEDHLTDDGYIAVWITNKDIFNQLTLEMFELWDVTLVEEWTWLKVTDQGEPICAVDSSWRKPYEILLVARRGGDNEAVKRGVLVGVPDLHSRKPSAGLLEEIVTGTSEGESLEVFARNLTTGWWSWGNEILKYQATDHWLAEKDNVLDTSERLESENEEMIEQTSE